MESRAGFSPGNKEVWSGVWPGELTVLSFLVNPEFGVTDPMWQCLYV